VIGVRGTNHKEAGWDMKWKGGGGEEESGGGRTGV